MARALTPATSSLVAGPTRGRAHELVLVVDDEESYRDALSIGLSQEGFDVVCAADGAEARAAVRRDRPGTRHAGVATPPACRHPSRRA